MNTDRTSTDTVNGLSQKYFGNTRFLRSIQIVSWIVTAIFLAALVWLVLQALVNGNPVPVDLRGGLASQTKLSILTYPMPSREQWRVSTRVAMLVLLLAGS